MAARKRGEGKTPHRTIRVEHDPWLPFGANCARVGSDRTAVLVEFVRWFNREPGARLPKRPDTPLSDGEYDLVMKTARESDD